nr:transposase [Arsukibacterium indicum]
MTKQRFTPEFKAEAIKQITERGYSVKEVSERLGVSDNSLYNWLKQHKQATEPDPALAGDRLSCLFWCRTSHVRLNRAAHL